MKVDLHTHILPADLPDFARRFADPRFLTLDHYAPGCARMMREGKPFRDIRANAWSPTARIEECDAAGVDVQVLSTVPVLFSYWAEPEQGLALARVLNDHIAEVVAAHPRRFVGLGTLPMQAPRLATQELTRCVRELGLAGIEIGTHVNGKNLDAPEVVEVLAAASDLGAAVFVHPWDMLGNERMQSYFLPWLVGMPAEGALAIASLIFGGVFDKLPRLRLCVAHGGGAFAGTLGRIAAGYAARPDLCAVNIKHGPREYVRRFYVDSLVHDADVLRRLVRLFGAERVALGSDYPFPLGEARPGQLIAELGELSAGERERLLSGTALEFLGRTASA